MALEQSLKVSCLCITERRPLFLKRSIKCFLSQTHENTELIIHYPKSDTVTYNIISEFEDVRINSVPIEYSKHETLGDKRNRTLEQATGDYICTWDDDDWYHPDRIKDQLYDSCRYGKHGSILVKILICDVTQKRAYLSHMRPWEQTIFCNKSLFDKVKYPSQQTGEDTAVFQLFLNDLFPTVKPWLFIYSFSGLNVSGGSHFNKIFSKSTCLNNKEALVISSVLSSIDESKQDNLITPELLSKWDYFQ